MSTDVQAIGRVGAELQDGFGCGFAVISREDNWSGVGVDGGGCRVRESFLEEELEDHVSVGGGGYGSHLGGKGWGRVMGGCLMG